MSDPLVVRRARGRSEGGARWFPPERFPRELVDDAHFLEGGFEAPQARPRRIAAVRHRAHVDDAADPLVLKRRQKHLELEVAMTDREQLHGTLPERFGPKTD